ncbi:MAG: carbamoyltransferase C-terminal domain-containing protein, partial [Anaerolineales bacterium]
MKFTYLSIFLFLLAMPALAQQPALPKTVVFAYDEQGDPPYGYRIPSLVTTKSGDLLAIAERRIGLHDHAQNDIVCKRSEDQGKTWSELQVIYEDGKNSLNDPSAVVLRSGRILLMFQLYPYLVHSRTEGNIQIADIGYDGPRNTKSYITYSDDEGKTWSTPKEITKQVRPSERISIGSPGIGIQLTRGEHEGRVVIPIYETKKISEKDSQKRGLEKLSIKRSDVPAITHVDFSARIHTVDRKSNPYFYSVIDEFHKLTGCPIIINTSFNVMGEPIVNSPEDAYRCFMRTNMDYLVLEDFLIEKQSQDFIQTDEDWARE